LALAGDARLAEIAADIGGALALGRTKSEQQRGPLQYFNSLLKSPVERVPILVPLARETIAWHKTNRLLGLNP
jgi:hypothetical protein